MSGVPSTAGGRSGARTGAGARRPLVVAAALIAAGALAQILLFERRVLWLHRLPGWFWSFHRTELPAAWPYLAIVAASLGLLLAGLRRRSGRLRTLALVAAVGWIVQISFALMEGRGLEAVQEHMVVTGHAAFARDVLRLPDLLDATRRYEELLDRRQISSENATKPPGQILVYGWTDRLAAALAPWLPAMTRSDRMTLIAALVWPLLAYAVVLPIAALGRTVGSGATGPGATALCITLPSLTLMTLHLDQALYPTLAATPVLAFAAARRRASVALGAVAGALYGTAVFVSFSLAGVAVLLLVDSLLAPDASRSASAIRARDDRRPVLGGFGRAWLGFLAGFMALDLILRLTLHYDVIRRWAGAIVFHATWKRIDWSWENQVHYAVIDSAEFALWVGAPIILLAAARLLRAVRRIGRGRVRRGDALAVAAAATLVALAVFGRTAAESGRLWLFMAPFLAIGAAQEIEAAGRRRGRLLLGAAMVAQILVVYSTKRCQDFF